jgi:hypothetical protein
MSMTNYRETGVVFTRSKNTSSRVLRRACARLEERLVTERDRSSKVTSQVSNLKLALEDAQKSQQLSSQRKAEADAQVTGAQQRTEAP